MPRLIFITHHVCENNGDIAILGSLPELGEWNPSKGIKAHQHPEGTWEAEITISPGQELEFKLVVLFNDGRVKWEERPNRIITIPSNHTVYILTWNHDMEVSEMKSSSATTSLRNRKKDQHSPFLIKSVNEQVQDVAAKESSESMSSENPLKQSDRSQTEELVSSQQDSSETESQNALSDKHILVVNSHDEAESSGLSQGSETVSQNRLPTEVLARDPKLQEDRHGDEQSDNVYLDNKVINGISGNCKEDGEKNEDKIRVMSPLFMEFQSVKKTKDLLQEMSYNGLVERVKYDNINTTIIHILYIFFLLSVVFLLSYIMISYVDSSRPIL